MNPDSTPVFPILPSFLSSGQLDLTNTEAYVTYLHTQGAKTVMTTAGTSQFNLMSTDEILALNACVASTFPGRVILGAPPLAEVLLAPFLATTVERHPRAELMLTYPERLYGESDVIDFFRRMASSCPIPVNIHGLPLRRAQGGLQDYTSHIIDGITQAVGNVTGMKEECSTYEAGFRLCSTVSRQTDFEFIVAGGSMRRYMLLHVAGAQSFFAGIGSLFPLIELAFSRYVRSGNQGKAASLISQLETPVFHVFMDIGWHKALRHAAKSVGLINGAERKPMTEPNSEERSRIEHALTLLKEGMMRLTDKGAL